MNILIILINILLIINKILCNELKDSEIYLTDQEDENYNLYQNQNQTHFISTDYNNTYLNFYLTNNTFFNQQNLFFDYFIKERNNNNNLQYLLVKLYNDIKFWRNLFIVVGAIITICGCTLNTLCIFIFFKSKLFHNSSFPYYVYVLSIVDSLCLIIRYVVPQASEMLITSVLFNKYNATNDVQYEEYTNHIVSDLHCNILMYVHNTLGFASTWIMAAISIERWLVIKYPLQTKSMIKLRAFLILTIIIVIVFIINLFDFAPNFYNKPHWFSNLTLLCEPFDSVQYISLGKLSLNADTYSIIRILLQAVGPFVVALLFNSLIIHNFKRIKTAAYRIKSTSSVSVMMSPSHSSNCYNNCNKQQNSPVIKHYSKKLYHEQQQQNDANNHLKPSNNNNETHYGLTLMPPLSQGHDSSTCSINNNNSHQQQYLSSSTVGGTTIGGATTTTTTNTVPVNTTTKYSFKRRLSKLRLHRETDVMLIVLSFSILITQLPCTITWYLIYYRLLLTYITDMYLAARSPILIYILRLIEMLYFSMNFIFYITLSPSLRKELKLSPIKLINKYFNKSEKDTNKNACKLKEFIFTKPKEANSNNEVTTQQHSQPVQQQQQQQLKDNKKFSLFSCCFNLFKKNKNNNNLLIYKVKCKSRKESQKHDIKIVIDNYENNNNNNNEKVLFENDDKNDEEIKLNNVFDDSIQVDDKKDNEMINVSLLNEES